MRTNSRTYCYIYLKKNTNQIVVFCNFPFFDTNKSWKQQNCAVHLSIFCWKEVWSKEKWTGTTHMCIGKLWYYIIETESNQ